MVTHDLEYLDKCDRVLVLMPGGRMAFYGSSDDGLRYFGKTRWAEVYRAFRQQPERDWTGEFRRSFCHQNYAATGLIGQTPESVRRVPEPSSAPRNRLAQLTTLCRRYATLIAADRFFLLLLLAVPILLGCLIRASAGGPGLRGPWAETALLLQVIIAAFTGGFSFVQELIKEREMCRRERTAGLSAGAYLLSQVTVLGLTTVVQAALVVAAFIWVFGQVLTGGATDPNSAPLLALLSLAYWPLATAGPWARRPRANGPPGMAAGRTEEKFA